MDRTEYIIYHANIASLIGKATTASAMLGHPDNDLGEDITRALWEVNHALGALLERIWAPPFPPYRPRGY